jgi:hypothetical protein
MAPSRVRKSQRRYKNGESTLLEQKYRRNAVVRNTEYAEGKRGQHSNLSLTSQMLLGSKEVVAIADKNLDEVALYCK